MRKFQKSTKRLRLRRLLPFAATAIILGLAVWGAPPTSANHPVLVEGNCDSPVPGTTLVTSGTCGDYDGDTRIGTAEDTDGADRIFGTLNAAIGPGTGAAAGTGANFNGRVIIVASGRFPELINFSTGSHLQIEAAPGVEANIDAVLQGDPAGGNNVRQESIGLTVNIDSGASVILRNLTIRNFKTGMRVTGAGRILVDDCRFDNNLDYGIQVLGTTGLVVETSRITGTGRRVGTANNTTLLGHGINVGDAAGAVINKSIIINSKGAGIQNTSVALVFEVVFAYNDGGTSIGNALIKGTY